MYRLVIRLTWEAEIFYYRATAKLFRVLADLTDWFGYTVCGREIWEFQKLQHMSDEVK